MTTGHHIFACAIPSCSLPDTCGSGSRRGQMSLLHGLRTSRYREGHAVRRSPRRWGVTPHIGPQVVRVGGSLLSCRSSPSQCWLVSSERIARCSRRRNRFLRRCYKTGHASLPASGSSATRALRGTFPLTGTLQSEGSRLRPKSYPLRSDSVRRSGHLDRYCCDHLTVTVPTSAYPGHYPRPSLLGESCSRPASGWHLLQLKHGAGFLRS